MRVTSKMTNIMVKARIFGPLDKNMLVIGIMAKGMVMAQ